MFLIRILGGNKVFGLQSTSSSKNLPSPVVAEVIFLPPTQFTGNVCQVVLVVIQRVHEQTVQQE